MTVTLTDNMTKSGIASHGIVKGRRLVVTGGWTRSSIAYAVA